MAEVDAAEELQSYFIGFDDILHHVDVCADNLATEYLERKPGRLCYNFVWDDLPARNR